MVAIKRAVEPELKQQAEDRQKIGKRLPCAESAQGKTRDKVAKFVGISHDTLDKAEKIMQAAEQNPELKHLVEKLDSKEISVNSAYQVVERSEEAEGIPFRFFARYAR